jgi:hypothetical protein
LIACDNGSSTDVRTLEPGDVEPRPTLAVSSGAPEVDRVIIESIAKDDIALAGLAGYQNVACRADGDPGDAPICRDSESPEDIVEVLAASACENGWVRPENVPDAFRLALAPDTPELLIAYRPLYPEGTFGGGFGATSVVVFATGSREDGTPKGTALHVREGRIVWIQNDCANVSELVTSPFIESFLIQPAATPAAPPADTPAPPVETPIP